MTKRANEKDAHKLRSQLTAAFDLMAIASECKCTQGFEFDDDGILQPVKACTTRLDHALRVARQAAEGFSSGRDPSTSGGDVANPTLTAVLAQSKADGTWRAHMGPDWWYDVLLSSVSVINSAAGNMTVLVAELAKITTTDPKDLGKNGQGTCPVCDRFCSGAHNDRLESGLCHTDFVAWGRAGRPERFYWVQQRRGELAS